MATLTDTSGVVVFEGEIAGVSGLPTGWVADSPAPGMLDAALGGIVNLTTLTTPQGASFGGNGFDVKEGTFQDDLATPNVIVSVLCGAADPSAGAGIDRNIGSLYLGSAGGVGSLWVKTGAANTAWTQLATVP